MEYINTERIETRFLRLIKILSVNPDLNKLILLLFSYIYKKTILIKIIK